MCLSEVTEGFSSDEAALDEARRRLHAFWDACMGSVIHASPRAEFLLWRLGEQRRNLRVAVDACTRHSRPAGDEMIYEFLRAACACLHLALSSGALCAVRRAAYSKRALENKAGSWPSNLKQLFAHDALSSTHSLVMWCTELRTPEPLLLLGDMVLIAHPLVCSAIVQNPQLHRDLIRVVLGCSFAYSSWKMNNPERPQDVSVAESQVLTDNMVAAGRFLTSILSGPDALPEVFVAIVEGYETLLWSSLESSLLVVDPQTPIHGSFLRLMATLKHLIPPPPPDWQMVPGCMNWFRSPDKRTFVDVVSETFRRLRNARRFCHRCWRPALTADLTTPEGQTYFLACGRCKVTRYCGHECQRADWKDGEPLRHRAVCALLARVRAATEAETVYERLEDCIASVEFSREEQIALSLCALNPKLLAVAMLARGAQIHRELLGDDEHPPASVKALARVDLLKAELDNKVARIQARVQAELDRDDLSPSRE